MVHNEKTLPETLTRHYEPGEHYFVFRKPFLINRGVKSITPEEKEQGRTTSKFEREVTRRQVSDHDVFIGVMGFKSLDLLALIGRDVGRSYQNAVLYDVNWRQVQAMRRVIEMIRKCETPEEFKKAFRKDYIDMMAQPAPGNPDDIYCKTPAARAAYTYEHSKYYNVFGANKAKYQPQTETDLAKYFHEIEGDTHSWLHPENYEHLRGIIKAGKVTLVHMDLRDHDRVEMLRNWLESNNLRVGDMYVSSVMGFMDPYLKTDYYSKDSDLEKAKDFYRDLLSLVIDPSHRLSGEEMDKLLDAPDDSLKYKLDKKARFIVSNPDPNHAFMQDYYLNTLTPEQLYNKKKSLELMTEPAATEKHHDFMFNTGDQVWRVMSIDGQPGVRYFRLSSELPVTDAAHLKKQMDVINGVIDTINNDLKELNLPQIKQPKDMLGEETVIGLDNTRDAQYYAGQEEQTSALMKNDESRGQPHYVYLSSKPFMIQTLPGQDPAATLKVLQGRIEQELDKLNGREFPEPLVPVVRRTAVQELLNRAGRGLRPGERHMGGGGQGAEQGGRGL